MAEFSLQIKTHPTQSSHSGKDTVVHFNREERTEIGLSKVRYT